MRKWLGIMAHAWAMLAAGAIVGGLLGLLAAIRTPPLFEATATVILTPPAAIVSPTPERRDMFATPSMRTIFANTSVAAQVVQELQLDRPPHSLTPEAFRTRALATEEIPNTNVTRVKVRLSDPQLAATAATRVAERFGDLTARIWHDWITAEQAQLARQTEAARQGLAEAEQNWLAARLARNTSSRIEAPGANGPADPRRRLESAAARLKNAPAREAYRTEFELIRLETEVEVKREAFLDVAGRLETARIQQVSSPRPLRVLDAAAVPDHPVPGTRMRTIAIGVLAGLVLAACIVVGKEWRVHPSAPARVPRAGL